MCNPEDCCCDENCDCGCEDPVSECSSPEEWADCCGACEEPLLALELDPVEMDEEGKFGIAEMAGFGGS